MNRDLGVAAIICAMIVFTILPATVFAKEQAPQKQIEVVFVLDTTGSMSGLINAAKEKIWSIASTFTDTTPAPKIRMGLIGYRDRGDDYITRQVQLTEDLDSVYSSLMEFQAGGGGDGPESVNQALAEAVSAMKWSKSNNSMKILYLVGDAPPHLDYQDDTHYKISTSVAVERGIVINAIQCGGQADTTPVWKEIAALGKGEYFKVAQSGSAILEHSPYDKEIATLSAELDATRIGYGTEKEQKAAANKFGQSIGINAKAEPAALARRSVLNVSKSGKANLYGDKELLNDIEDGRVELEEISADALPAKLREMSDSERAEHVKRLQLERKGLTEKIQQLGKQRQTYLEKKVKSKAESKDSLDFQLFRSIKKQAAEHGIEYEGGPKL